MSDDFGCVELPTLTFPNDYKLQTFGVDGEWYHYIACNGKDVYWTRNAGLTIREYYKNLGVFLGIDLLYIYEYQIKNSEENTDEDEYWSYCASSHTHDNMAKHGDVLIFSYFKNELEEMIKGSEKLHENEIIKTLNIFIEE